MAENLRYHDVEADPMLKDNSWCAFEDEKKCKTGGYLYSFAGVMLDTSCVDSKCDYAYPYRGICPEGWHVAENYEWQELADIARGEDLLLAEYPGFDWSPTGEYNADEGEVVADGSARYWTSSTRASLSAFEWLLEDGATDFFRLENGKEYGFAVRCVANSVPKLDAKVEYEPRSSSSRKRVSSSSAKSSSSSAVRESYIEGDRYNAFTDKRDGNVYRVAEIGSQVWMAEDLRYYSKDMEYPSLTVCTQTGDTECKGKRRLYSFYAAMDDRRCKVGEYCWGIKYPHRGICPEGWHLPEIGEWWALSDNVNFMGGALNSSNETDLARGRRANDFGFSAFPTGEWNGEYTRYDDIARYWTATESDKNDPRSAVEFYISGIQSFSQTYLKDYGYAVRCVADAGAVKLDTLVEEPSSSSESSSSSVAESSSAESSSSVEESSSSSEELSSSSEEAEVSSSSAMVYVFRDDLETFTDARDGEVYTVTTVGKQVWMGENLRYADSVETPALKGSMFCWQGAPENCKTMGALYLWSAVVGETAENCGYEVDCKVAEPVRGICPEGFHVPSHREWQALQSFIGNSGVSKLFAKPQGADLYGFGAIPTGEVDLRYDDLKFASETAAHYWSSTERSVKSSYTWYITNQKFDGQEYDKRMGFAVRCIKDAENTLE